MCIAVLTSSGCQVPEPHVTASITALDAGQPTLALQQLDDAARFFPTSSIVALDRGVALVAMKRHDDAITAFRRAITLDDGQHEARIRNDLAIALARSGRSKDALIELRKALRTDPTFEDARHNYEVLISQKKTPAKVGMSDRIKLRSDDLQRNPDVVFDARLEPANASMPDKPYWMAHLFALFDGQEWFNAAPRTEPAPSVTLRPLQPLAIVQRISLHEGYASKTLVGLTEPLLFEDARDADGGALLLIESTSQEAATRELASTYRVTSGPGMESDDVLPLTNPGLWLQLPALDERIAPLAVQIIGNTTDPLVAATRLRQWFEREFRYSRQGADAFADDPLAAFLFVRRAGHCEEFATAIAVLLRTQGHASRVVSGFNGGRRAGGVYVVTGNDAHAWAQVYSPTFGWVTVDPQVPPEDTKVGKNQQRGAAPSPLGVLNFPTVVTPRRNGDGGTAPFVRDW